MLILNLWWVFYSAQDLANLHTVSGFLPWLVILLVLFLLNAAALPDQVLSQEEIDLKAFYWRNASYFWVLMAVYIGLIVLRALGGVLLSVPFAELQTGELLLAFAPNLIIIAIGLMLARLRVAWLHHIAVACLLAFFFYAWFSLRLELPTAESSRVEPQVQGKIEDPSAAAMTQ